MAIDLCDLVNILDKIVSLGTLKMTLRASRFQNFLGKKPQDPPSGSPDRHSRDSSVIEKYPDFTYSKGWTVSIR